MAIRWRADVELAVAAAAEAVARRRCPTRPGSGAVPSWRAKRGAVRGSGPCRPSRRRAWRPSAAPQPSRASRVGARAATQHGDLALQARRSARVSSRMRATSSRAMRATVPGRSASRASRPSRTPPRSSARPRAPRRASARGGASAGGCSMRVRSATRSSRWSTSRRTSRSGPSSSGDRQVGLAQGRPGDRERVDRVALAGLAPRAAGPGHQLGRRPAPPLARAQQVALQAAGTGGGSPPARSGRSGAARRPSAARSRWPAGVAARRSSRRACDPSRRPPPAVWRALVQIGSDDRPCPLSPS